jgi:hypothetical protein
MQGATASKRFEKWAAARFTYIFIFHIISLFIVLDSTEKHDSQRYSYNILIEHKSGINADDITETRLIYSALQVTRD